MDAFPEGRLCSGVGGLAVRGEGKNKKPRSCLLAEDRSGASDSECRQAVFFLRTGIVTGLMPWYTWLPAMVPKMRLADLRPRI
jgi:hypothetical protein